MAAIDHLLLGCADLEAGMEWFEARSCVRPAPGGEHARWGTHNALVSLASGCYLELLAPKPALGPYRFPVDVRSCRSPRLVTWAVAVDDLDAVLRHARASGIDTSDPIDGGRLRPDGRRLTWRTARALAEPARADLDVWPFVIEWGADTPHPSLDAASGCGLADFSCMWDRASGMHQWGRASALPDTRRPGLSAWLATIGLPLTVGDGEPALHATLETPAGPLVLSSSAGPES